MKCDTCLEEDDTVSTEKPTCDLCLEYLRQEEIEYEENLHDAEMDSCVPLEEVDAWEDEEK